ncbi:MAG TPA: gluconate 2-dehydrogenase subunit 3 family protein [Chitinophagaceae bacterium]|nr:gluconate 2-dehydrogenase subunit 3 family protein [Chitinophagaceae bacterium]
MDRKEAVQYISLLLGGTLVGVNSFLAGCKTADKQALAEEDTAYLDEIAETILPETKTPGAKAAKAGSFMLLMVNDCYDEKEQMIFREGMKKINDQSETKFGKSYMSITSQQRHELLVQIDNEQKQYMKTKKEDQPVHYFRMMKELTLLGYFTSKPGCTQAKRYMPIPGKYIGCVPYKKGDKAIV